MRPASLKEVSRKRCFEICRLRRRNPVSGMNFKNTLPYSVFCQKAPSFSRFGCLEGAFAWGKSHTFDFIGCAAASCAWIRAVKPGMVLRAGVSGPRRASALSGSGAFRFRRSPGSGAFRPRHFPASALSGLRRFPAPALSGLGAFRLRRSPARVFFNAGVDGTFRLRAPARRPGTPRLLQSTSGSRFFRRVSCAGGPCLLCFVQIPMPPSAAAACGIRRLGSRREAGGWFCALGGLGCGRRPLCKKL